MFLSDIVGKNIYVGKNLRGVCLGIGFSLTNRAVKYLLCSDTPTQKQRTDFAVSVSAVENLGAMISLNKLRPVHPKRHAKIFLDRPVFSSDGNFLGNVEDLEFRDWTAINLFTDQNECYPVLSISACSDAVILRNDFTYPIGQRVPLHKLSFYTEKPDPTVTKLLLKTAIQKRALIRLTLSLPPFRLDLPARLDGVFRGKL